MKAVFLSDKGKVRQHNEDSAGVFHNLDGNVLAVVEMEWEVIELVM